MMIEEKIKDMDFIAIASTQWHAICVDSAIYSLNKRLDKKTKGLILVSRYGANFRISSDDFSADEFADVEYIKINDKENNFFERAFSFFKDHVKLFFKIRNIKKDYENQKELFLISPVAPFNRLLLYFNREIAKKYKVTFICDDGGLGAYMPKGFSKASNEASKGSSKLKLFLMEEGLNFDKRVRNSYIDHVKVERRNLFLKENDDLVPNEEVLESYKAVLKIRNYNKDLADSLKEKSVLIVTQPYSEMGFISEEDEFKVIEDIINFLDKKILLKPHPREDKNKYNSLTEKYSNIEILDNSFSIEELLPSLNLYFIIGFTSSTLINAKIFYNIESISFADLVCKYSEDPVLLESSKELKKISKKFITFLDEANKILIFNK